MGDLVRYCVTVYTEAHATAEIVAPAGATDAELREAVLRQCDAGTVSFEPDYGATEAHELTATDTCGWSQHGDPRLKLTRDTAGAS